MRWARRVQEMKVTSLSVVPIVLAFSFAVALAVVAVSYYMPAAYAQEQTEEQEEERTEETEEEATAEDEAETTTEDEEETEASDVVYSYVAQTGDSYSKIARKAVQTYGLKYEVSLSQAQIIFAETNLTLEAGSPSLNEGEAVEVSEATVKAWVDQAEDLSDDAEAAWALYTAGVNFNTDNVGESR